MFFIIPNSRKAILNKLSRHKPIPASICDAKIRLRWLLTLGFVLLLPVSIMASVFFPYLLVKVPSTLVSIAAFVGLSAIYVAWQANKKDGVERQWGLAPLSADQIEEFISLYSEIPEIESVITDNWLGDWGETRSHIRGQDLALLKRCVNRYRSLEEAKRH